MFWLTHLKGHLFIKIRAVLAYFFCTIWLTWTRCLHAQCNIRKCVPGMLNNYDSSFKFAQHLQGCKSRTAAVWLLFSSAPSSASPDHCCHLSIDLDLQILAYNNTYNYNAYNYNKIMILSHNYPLFSCMCALFLSHGYCKGCTDTTFSTPRMNEHILWSLLILKWLTYLILINQGRHGTRCLSFPDLNTGHKKRYACPCI